MKRTTLFSISFFLFLFPGGIFSQTVKPVKVPLTIQYSKIPGVDQKLLSLDIYSPAGKGPFPVIIYVHGGGWCSEDKSEVYFKADYFTGLGYIFVSMNYRLSLDPRKKSYGIVTDTVRYPVHEQDVASGISWVFHHIAEYHGNPGKIGLMGHSSGAHMVSLVSTDESFLREQGLGLSNIRCTCELDAGVLDIPARIGEISVLFHQMVLSGFGPDSTLWSKASPTLNITPGKKIPKMLLVHEIQESGRISDHQKMYNMLLKNGYKAEILPIDLSHDEIKCLIGMVNQEDYESLASKGFKFSPAAQQLAIILTDRIRDFFMECFNDK